MASGPIADQLLKVDILKGGTGGYGVNNYVSSLGFILHLLIVLIFLGNLVDLYWNFYFDCWRIRLGLQRFKKNRKWLWELIMTIGII